MESCEPLSSHMFGHGADLLFVNDFKKSPKMVGQKIYPAKSMKSAEMIV